MRSYMRNRELKSCIAHIQSIICSALQNACKSLGAKYGERYTGMNLVQSVKMATIGRLARRSGLSALGHRSVSVGFVLIFGNTYCEV